MGPGLDWTVAPGWQANNTGVMFCLVDIHDVHITSVP